MSSSHSSLPSCGVDVAATDEFCPYVGLQPYTEAEREFFFGREADVRIIISNLYASRLTVFYGASGTGKSSVLMAGVLPQLEATSRTTVIVFRDWQGAGFLTALKERCSGAAAQRAVKPVSVDPTLPLDELLGRVAVAGHTVVLLLDQFEEYFLYRAAGAAGDAFEAELARTINRDDVHVNTLVSMREDALSMLDRFRPRIPNLLANTLRLDHMGPAAAELAIRKPLEVYNQRYPDDPVAIEDALISEVLEQVRRGRVHLGQAGRGGAAMRDESVQIETPFLQLVMTRLWREERRRRPTVLRRTTFVDQLGGAAQIVRSHLADVMNGLSVKQQELCARFFDRPVTPSGSKVACRIDDLTKWAGEGSAEVPAVLESLNRGRILRGVAPAGGDDEPQVEVFHDVLASSILDWCVSFLAARQRRRARRAVAVVVAVLTAALASAGAYALYLRQSVQTADTAKQALKNAYTQLVKDLPATERSEYGSANDVIQKALSVAPVPSEQPSTSPSSSQHTAARIYLQIQDEQQRSAAELVSKALASDGFIVPGIELVKTGPKSTEVRFFRKADADGAEKIAGILRESRVPSVIVKYVPGFENSARVRPQQYEIWFAPGGTSTSTGY